MQGIPRKKGAKLNSAASESGARDEDSASANDGSDLSFEQAMERLEQIVVDLQRDNLPLEEGIARYEEGIRYVKRCHETLRRAEERIELLMSVGPDGEAEVTKFEDAGGGTDLAEKSAKRGERRSRLPPRLPSTGLDPGTGPGRSRSEELF